MSSKINSIVHSGSGYGYGYGYGEGDGYGYGYVVRKWDDTEWHKPTREYLGL